MRNIELHSKQLFVPSWVSLSYEALPLFLPPLEQYGRFGGHREPPKLR